VKATRTTALHRVRTMYKVGAFLRDARACWDDSTPEQRARMVRLIRHNWRNHTAQWVAGT